MQPRLSPSPSLPSQPLIEEDVHFEGFDPPESNFWRLPNSWFNVVASFTSWAEHKVVEYILRHTWGYQEYDICKLITMDEFMHGRKRRDGTRIDAGCGMAENSIKKGIADAVTHGFLVVEIDDSDRGRIKKFYGPRMRRPQQDEGGHTAVSLQREAREHATPLQTTRRMPRAVVADGTLQHEQQAPGDQTLRVGGQLLTPGHQEMTLQQQPLTPRDQSRTPRGQQLTRSTAATDPHTEQTLPVIHVLKDTGQQTTVAAASRHILERKAGGGLHVPQQPVERSASGDPEVGTTGLIEMLVTEGIAESKARSLVLHYPADQILRQLRWIDARKYQNRSATLVSAIERDYEQPVQRRSAADEPGTFDSSKFYRGAYALCENCHSRPCSCRSVTFPPQRGVR